MHVLVAEDDPDVREVLCVILSSHGWVTSSFSGVRECLSALTDQAKCIVSDIEMPDMDGVDLIEHLNQLGMNIPVILLTGLPDDNVRLSAARRAKAAAILKKPCSGALLTKAVSLAIRSTRT